MRWFLEGSSMCKILGWGDGAGHVMGRAEGNTEGQRKKDSKRGPGV